MFQAGVGRVGRRKALFLSLAAGIVVVCAGVGGFLISQRMGSQAESKADSNANTTARVLEQVGRLYELPTGETPTVAQIQDKSKLDGQEFFTKSKEGDYLLVYSKAKIALLYRESTGKLVNVGPVNLENQASKEAGQ